MKEKNIDEIFSRKLQNLEKTPRLQAWEKLSAQLEKPKRKVIPLWWTLSGAGIAASIALMALLYHNSPETQSIKPPLTVKHDTVGKSKPEIAETKKIPAENQVSSNYDKQPPAEKPVVKDNSRQFVDSKTVAIKNTGSEQQKTAIIPAEVIETTTLLSARNIDIKLSEAVLPSDLVIIVEEDGSVTEAPYESQKTKIAKVFQQLKNLKEGNKVDLKGLGISKQTFVAAIKEKFN